MTKMAYILLLCLSLTTWAEDEPSIIHDGTLGGYVEMLPQDNLYLISDTNGQINGTNLFHSFERFNLEQNQTAQFQTTLSIQNVITRVTSEASTIDGTIQVNNQANFYFLNPYGINFGANAKLDINGSFYASTADTLNFADGGQFNARNPEQSLLSVAPVTSFGFLTDAPASISTLNTKFSVPDTKTISLIGGNININAGSSPTIHSEDPDAPYGGVPDVSFHSQLLATSGRINLASIAQQGTISLTESGIKPQGQQGNITIANAQISTTGNENSPAGNIYINAENIEIKESFVESRVYNDTQGGLIDIQGKQITLKDGGRIIASTYSTGEGSDIHIKADQLHATGTSSLWISKAPGGNRIYVESLSKKLNSGNAGNLLIQAENIYFDKASEIYAATRGGGTGGNITLEAKQNIEFTGGSNLASGNQVYIQTHSKEEGAGHGGNLLFTAKNIYFSEGASISATTYGKGDGSIITLKAQEAIKFEKLHEKSSYGSSIWASSSRVSNGGEAANIIIEAKELTLSDGAYMTTAAYGQGDAGDIFINVTDTATIKGANARSGWASYVGANSNPKAGDDGKNIGGNGGIVTINAKNLILKNGGIIASSTIAPEDADIISSHGGDIIINAQDSIILSGVNPYGENEDGLGSTISVRSKGKNAGQAGEISLSAKSLTIENGAFISSSTAGTTQGGQIHIDIKDNLKISGTSNNIPIDQEPRSSQKAFLSDFPNNIPLRESSIVAYSEFSEQNAGDAGSIVVSANQLHITYNAFINTSTQNSSGGSITITTPNILHLRQGQITTDVKGGSGDGGNISINTPQFTILDNGTIVTKAGTGKGGNITINAQQLLASKQSISLNQPNINAINVLDASSNLAENFGEIRVPTVTEDVERELLALPNTLLNADDLLRGRCGNISQEDLSSLITINQDVPSLQLSPF
ncbi:filamentous hemagglutinin N-terminal domain-containing protein [Candidatus Albibeggiatoa sp. nov. NOAA]|uniref:two-partner secretion domain-containing protein n=1 Tax=Candidatus Albibeggiatoa sp. nov. NOAA TaxID=3162724 RepID=UPI0033037CC5|nr:filamentous hemagglutinin N-terminal domain-containing protein [Thiotrichaceae bacterium]